MKVANWNIEWMNRWFTGDDDGAPRFKAPSEIAGVTNIEDLALRVAQVILALDADVLTIQEGPSRRAEMALFVREFLNDRFEIFGPVGMGQQKLYALVKKATAEIDLIERLPGEFGFDFDDEFEVDIDGDLVLDLYGFTRPPLLLRLRTSKGRVIRILNLHTKSKFIHQGRRLFENPVTRDEFIKKAVLVRRRISAEAMRMRTYLNAVFAQEPEASLIVMGDFNDGPDLDIFEAQYLTHNVAGLIAGSPYQPQHMLRHTFVDLMDAERNFTAEFFDFVIGEDRKVLLDHIFVSASLYWTGEARTATGQIEHEIWERAVRQDLPGERERLPSDHRPQSAV
ncbi:MAG: endonuclease/exonuclease/phosphatase family protein, partial [Pseudomonadota bacterium]